jgi:hypothetical protein
VIPNSNAICSSSFIAHSLYLKGRTAIDTMFRVDQNLQMSVGDWAIWWILPFWLNLKCHLGLRSLTLETALTQYPCSESGELSVSLLFPQSNLSSPLLDPFPLQYTLSSSCFPPLIHFLRSRRLASAVVQISSRELRRRPSYPSPSPDALLWLLLPANIRSAWILFASFLNLDRNLSRWLLHEI